LESIDEEFSDPNLYIAMDPNMPSALTYYARCGFYGEDFCVISSTELKAYTIINIGVNCETRCSFQLQASLSDEM
jgi:hypothetical protein